MILEFRWADAAEKKKHSCPHIGAKCSRYHPNLRQRRVFRLCNGSARPARRGPLGSGWPDFGRRGFHSPPFAAALLAGLGSSTHLSAIL